MSGLTRSARRLVRPLLLAPLVVVLLWSSAGAATAPIEDPASYQPQTRCAPAAKAGTVVFAHWLVHRYGGGYGAISRACSSGGVSEHKEGRAFDWTISARKAADRRRAADFLALITKPDAAGDADALARRMGVMYVIWDDHIYAAYDGFSKRAYLASGCTTAASCSPTLQHRDHLHVSLSRAGGLGRTSWYAGKLG